MKKAFINSMPKAGTNLLSRFLCLSGLTKVRLSFRQIPFDPLTTPILDYGYPLGGDYIRPVKRHLVDRRFSSLKDGQFLIGHFGYSHCFLDLASKIDAQVIVMIRDPRAVLNSFVHYVVKERRHPMHKYFNSLSHEQRYEVAFRGGWAGKAYLEPMINRCYMLQPWLDLQDALLVRFEELIGAKGGGNDNHQTNVTKVIADRLGIPENSRSNAVKLLFGESNTFRSGQIDSWRLEIPVALQPEIDHTLRNILEAWHY
ncbi:sulfotransferase domain-containing protein [Thiorhodococcus fuscus]|uniref:Sulfotransferase domain-containing protein n=1 Tax=Thiorhodococcus fuscus TaxID=527200 RepID=A0ABW4YBQ1_9GAMM